MTKIQVIDALVKSQTKKYNIQSSHRVTDRMPKEQIQSLLIWHRKQHVLIRR